MQPTLYAQPYNLEVEGFYFRSSEEYTATYPTIKDGWGEQVEEFEIQMTNSESIDVALARAWQLSQANFAAFFKAADTWHREDKFAFIIAVGDCGYEFDPNTVIPANFDVQIYYLDRMNDLAIEFVEEGLLGDIPDALKTYFDYDAFARDLAHDYVKTIVARENIIYRCE